MSEPTTQVLLLRHADVASHRGDVPLTEEGVVRAERTGKVIAEQVDGPLTVLFGGTRRTRETADALVRGVSDPERVVGPLDSFALRNPDMYVAGTRVNMVSSAEALAEQVAGMTMEQAVANEWWSHFFDSSDRIGWWLGHPDPPGETAADLGARMARFLRTVGDPGPLQGRLVVCVTHSPVLRAVLLQATGDDPGEPGYVTGAQAVLAPSEPPHITAYDPLDP
jgi:broad specificity phosphatase PhoE